MSKESVKPAPPPTIKPRQAAADCIIRALETSHIAEICHAIGSATRLYNISPLAQRSGLARPSIHRAFAGDPIKPKLHDCSYCSRRNGLPVARHGAPRALAQNQRAWNQLQVVKSLNGVRAATHRIPAEDHRMSRRTGRKRKIRLSLFNSVGESFSKTTSKCVRMPRLIRIIASHVIGAGSRLETSSRSLLPLAICRKKSLFGEEAAKHLRARSHIRQHGLYCMSGFTNIRL